MSSNSEDSDSSEDETYIPPTDEKSGSENEEDEGDGKTGKEEISKTDVDKIWNDFKSDGKQKLETTNNKPSLETNMKLSENTAEGKNTVTVTKIYDFAGEEVKVTKKVSKDSKEAQSLLNSANNSSKQESVPVLGKVKRPGGLQGVLGKMNKKPKLSTLEKSKLDWQHFKDEKGIQEELRSHNKGKCGYLEKQFFLERTDFRQFEKERDLRQAKSTKK